MDELLVLHNKIMSATCCEDIFGIYDSSDGNIIDKVHSAYRRISKLVHPDRYTNIESKELATETFRKLTEFYGTAKKKITNGVYGQEIGSDEDEQGFIIRTRKNEYTVKSTLAEGDLSIIYSGDYLDENGLTNNIIVKIIENVDDNDFMRNEIKILKLFNSKHAAQNKHLPVLLDTFKTSEDNLGIILQLIDGYDLYSIREKYKDGINERHMIWILKRLLSTLGYVNKNGIIHGNIDPSHIIVRPRDHNVFLIDWSYAVINPKHTGDRFKILNDDFSAPEISKHNHPIPSSDLYSIGKCMIYLLGGDIKNNKIPERVNVQIKCFIRGLILESSHQRVQDAWRIYDELINLNDKLWKREFLEFKM